MDTRAFFDRVLPPTGGVYFANHGTKGLRQLPPMESLDLLTQKVFEHGVKKENVYFAVGVYQGSRTQEDARDKKALYLDLDCGEGKPFPTKASSVRALKQFCESSGFPLPNIVVDSGHGIHCYWTFERTVPIEQWNPMAAAFKQMCVDYEFHADPAITADSARIMRVPGTYNYKDPSHPIPCRILKADPTDFDPDALKTVLNAGFNKVADALTGEIKDDLSAGLYGERTYHAGDMIEQCAALRHTRDTGGKDQAGMLWHKILHLLAFTEDGQDYIHPVSNKHESYSSVATEQRFVYAKARKETVGPTLCKTIEGFLPSKCAGCPFRGNIKTPLVLGKSQDSFLPHGWKMTKEGCFKPTKFNEKGQAEDWVRAIPYMFSNVELYSTRIGNGLQLTAHNGPKMHSAMILGVDLVGDTRELSKNLMIDNIMMTDAEMQEFRRIMIPWMRKMEMVRNAKAAPLAGLGWMKSDELVGFATGRAIFLEDGTEAPVSGIDRTLAKDYMPTGEEQYWRIAANALLADECPAIQAAVLTAFTAPLMDYTGERGVIFSLYSRESGTGKSSALKVAQAVWGDPIRGVNALNDTVNSMVKKFGFLNNLPAYWDELRMRDDIKNTIHMIYQMAQGRGKQRLDSNSRMQDTGTWATFATVATNEPVCDHIDAAIGATNAGRMRVFEVVVPRRPLLDSTMPFKLRDLNTNFGHIGEHYAKWLSKNHKAVERLVQKIQSKVVAELAASNDERYWISFASAIIAAAHIATKLGYVSINVEAFTAWVYAEYRVQRASAGNEYVPIEQRAIEAVLDYADKVRDQLLVVDHATSRAQKDVGQIYVQPPIKEFLGLLAIKDKILRVKKSSFRDWLYESIQESPSEIIQKLRMLGATEHKASVSAGVANTVNARVTVLDIDLNNPAFQPVLEDYDG